MKQLPTVEDLPNPPCGRSGWPWTEGSDPLPETQPDGSPWPKISVVTPSYNQGQYLEETIRSVLLQGYPNLEYIIIDGGSTDESVSIIEKYDPWIDYWKSGPDDGQSDAINKGFQRATGEIYAWLNSDDYYAPGAIKTMATAFAEHDENIGALVGAGHKIDDNGEVIYTPDVPVLSREAFLDWMKYGHFMQPACFFRREAWEQAGPLRTDLRHPMDVDLWLKMIQAFEFERVSSTIAYAHQHEQAKTTGERQHMRAETIFLVAEHGGYEIAHREIMEMADDMVELEKDRQKLARITKNPLYKYVLGPAYHWIQSIL